MNLPGHRIAARLGKAALKTHALQTLRDCRASSNRAEHLECVRFIGAFCPAGDAHGSWPQSTAARPTGLSSRPESLGWEGPLPSRQLSLCTWTWAVWLSDIALLACLNTARPGRRRGIVSILELEQTENSALIIFAESERPFDAKVQVERVGTLRRQQASAENIRQSGRWKGIIASVHDPLPEPVRLPAQSSEREPANQTRHNCRVAIEIFVAVHHADKIRIIIFRIKKSARAAMGGDNSDALRERALQAQWIRELLRDHRAGMFVACVEHQYHTQLAGQRIKRIELAPPWIDSLDGRMNLDQAGARRNAPFQLLQGIGPY